MFDTGDSALTAGCPPDAPGVPEEIPQWVLEGGPAPTPANCEPSGFLALELDTATADPSWLSDPDLVDALVGFDRLASWALARQARLLAELARRRPADTVAHTARTAGIASEYAPDEVGVALHLSRGTAAARLHTAHRLLSVLPATFALWETGQIDTTKARAIHDATLVLPDHLATAIQARVLPNASHQTLAQLRAALARAVIAADPDGAENRHHTARRDRRVVLTPEADGMASLWALLTATDAASAYTWLTRLARGLGPDDPRTMDTRRADLLAALLSGRLVVDTGVAGDSDSESQDPAADSLESESPESDPAAASPAPAAVRPIHPVTPGKPLIQVVVPHSTLIGADDLPAELVGYGPIPACLARETATEGIWRRLVTDPLSGTLLDHGRTTYHPPAGLADHVRARDQHCRFPGCRRTAADAELDHLLPWADGGTTTAANLNALCGHHHRLKTHTQWRVAAHPDGRLTWTTPTGHRHTTRTHDHRPDPPPASATPPDTCDDPDPPPF